MDRSKRGKKKKSLPVSLFLNVTLSGWWSAGLTLQDWVYLHIQNCLNSKDKFPHFITSYSRDSNAHLALICKPVSVFWMIVQIKMCMWACKLKEYIITANI